MQERRREVPPSPPQGNETKVDRVHWKDLLALSPQDVTRRCLCTWQEHEGYVIHFLGETYLVDPSARTVRPKHGDSPIEPHLPLVLVMYLLKAQERPLEGRMITEREIPGGAFFFQHLHRLPTHHLEEAFGEDPDGFLRVGLALGGRKLDTSDASFDLSPLPRIPVGFHLWRADEEFPSRCVITFDSSIRHHLPLDAIWALTNVLAQRLIETKKRLQGGLSGSRST